MTDWAIPLSWGLGTTIGFAAGIIFMLIFDRQNPFRPGF